MISFSQVLILYEQQHNETSVRLTVASTNVTAHDKNKRY